MAPRVSSPVLIGRANELDRLGAAMARAREGRSGAVLLTGEAGVGKTRLVSEFAGLAEGEGVTVLLGGCIDLGEGALPYAPVVEALRRFVRHADAGELDAVFGNGRSELARLIPDLGPATDARESGLSVGSAQGRLFELVLGVLERLAARSPLAFIVEDLQWADRSTRDLLGFLVRNFREAAVLMVLTYRSDEVHGGHPLLPFVAELARTGRVERIELRPFDPRESAAQMRAIAGDELDAALIESIHGRSGGNAFFAEELLAAAGEDGTADLPSTLRDVLLARVSELAEPSQELLRIASAAGQRVDPALLAAAADLDEAALYDALRDCVRHQVLVPDPTSGIERYAFRHALLQEAVYDDLLPGERSRLHSAFAQTLEARSAGDPSRAAELAYHWYAAHDLPRALEAAVAAGMAAEARYAFPEAQAQYERAIDLWAHVPDAERRARRDQVDLLAALAGVAVFHQPARAVSHIESAIRLVDPAVDPIRAGLLNERLGRYAWMAGQGEVSKRAYGIAMDLIPPQPPSEARARAVAGLAQTQFLAGRFDESRPLAEEALVLARAVGARNIEGHALDTRGVDRAIVGDFGAAIDDMRAALRIAEEAGSVDDVGRAYVNWTWVLQIAGRADEAIEMAEVGVATAERLGLMGFFGTHLLHSNGDFLYGLGRWEEAERSARRAEDLEPLGTNHILVEELLGRIALARGRLDEAAERLGPLAPLAERALDIQFVAPVQASLAELALWRGSPKDAAASVATGIRLLHLSPEVRIGELYALGVRADADLAEIARARRSPEQERDAVAAGAALIEAIRGRHADVLATRPAFAALSEAWVLLCEAEATRMHRHPDPEAWVAGIEAWERLGRPYLVAYLRWREAEARLAARGDRGLAAAAVRAALDITTRLGAESLGDEVTALAVRARLSLERRDEEVHLAPADDAPDFGLTAREREVLGLVAQGRTNRQIAASLFISENTAGVHVSNILGKLGVAGRGEAAALAYRLGLVARGEPGH